MRVVLVWNLTGKTSADEVGPALGYDIIGVFFYDLMSFLRADGIMDAGSFIYSVAIHNIDRYRYVMTISCYDVEWGKHLCERLKQPPGMYKGKYVAYFRYDEDEEEAMANSNEEKEKLIVSAATDVP